MKTPLTIFSFGYWGWGNSTDRLVQAVDAVEKSRRFKPPVFVDTRIRRSVRAQGFNGNAFGDVLGERRYRWMQSLGNKRIITGSGPTIQIAEPAAAESLLDFALNAAKEKRRVIFFCSCLHAKEDGKISCHRATVASLLRKAAKSRGISIEVTEWPGGKNKSLNLDVSPNIFRSVATGRMTIPLGQEISLAEMCGLPWCSIATIHSNDQQIHRVVGPAVWQTSQWCLPVLYLYYDRDVRKREYQKTAASLRRKWGYDPV